jgi:colanic acid/amylovoran biosynthesis glycosyltransferase
MESPAPMRVLHSLEEYLPFTQNWIYPQIVQAPRTEAAVLCQSLSNLSEFPLSGPLFREEPRRFRRGSFRWAVRGALRRTGLMQKVARKRAWQWSPSIVHAHFGPAGWRALPLKKLARVPLITTFYGWDAWLLPATEALWLERYARLFNEGDLFLVEGPAMRQRMIEIGCPSQKVRVRRLGVDLSGIEFAEPDFRDGLKIAMVGRFIEKKGLVDGLRACLAAVRSGVRLEVTIIGDAFREDAKGQEIKRQLLAVSEAADLAGRVHFTGFVSPGIVRSILSRHNILLCPSKHSSDGDAEGGMPFVLAEAMAMGLVGIGSQHCDMGELIVDGTTGFLFGEGQVDKLVETLSNLPSKTGLLSEMAGRGRQLIETSFDLSQQLDELAAIYTSVRDASGH